MGEALTIWCDVKLPGGMEDELRARVRPHRLVKAAWPSGGGRDAADAGLGEADVALGNPPVEAVVGERRLMWVQLASAGYEKYDREDVRAAVRGRGAAVCNSSGVYADPCAQHVLAMMLGLARGLPMAAVAQQKPYPSEWNSNPVRRESFVLTGQSALILGYGAIARRLIELLRPFAMDLRVVRRRVRGDELAPAYEEEEIERLLAEADHVINVLPGGSGTRRFVNAARIARMKPGAYFYNVGRGTTVEQEALVRALREGKLGGAYLDVTDPEPPPAEDPIWSAPNCFVTPHSAGGYPQARRKVLEHFLENLERYTRGEELVDRVM